VGTNKNIFNLTKQFALLSFFCIVVIGTVSTIMVSKLITDKILLRDATLSREFVDSVIASEGTWRLFIDKPVRKSHREDRVSHWALESFFTHVALMPDVVRANVYGKDLCILWSSTPSMIGEFYQGNEELEKSLQGELVYGSGIVGVADKTEHIKFDEKLKGLRFVETYIPVWNRQHTEVVGSVELYRIPRMLHESILQAQRFVWLGALTGGLLLFFSLYWIVRRAALVMENQQQRLLEAKSLMVIGQTASAITHAMRNPLSSIRACAELSLTDDLEGVRESARDIMDETDRLDRWAREFLLFSVTNFETPEQVDLNELVESVVKEHDPLLNRLSITCQLQMADIPVDANFIPLSQAFGSLIMNAVEAMSEGGRLAITTSCDSRHKSAIVSFADTGPGLAEEIKDQLFQPFATTKPTGTGLGLALSRHLVEHYNGVLDIVSKPGKGVTVTVCLPMHGGRS
jgi:two-component system, NtrC family, sensor histidine kinase HydH